LRDEKTIEHAKSNHGLRGSRQVGGASGCHIQQLGVVLLKVLDHLGRADLGPASIEISGD
jgi:hypothetical protein